MIITTSVKPSERALAQASRLAAELSAELLPRRNLTVRKLQAMCDDKRLIVVTEEEVRFYGDDSPAPFFFHPSMAFVRVKRLRRGETDPLIELTGCRKGDRIVDCTAGLAADSLVFSYGAGPDGEVAALESEPILCSLVREGLAAYRTGLPDVDAAMRRVKLQAVDHLDFLKRLPDRSVDIVYFDPMFRQPIHESSSISPLRTLANPSALTEEAVWHARRAARRIVAMKENKGSDEFARLGFERRHANTSKVAYGVIEVE